MYSGNSTQSHWKPLKPRRVSFGKRPPLPPKLLLYAAAILSAAGVLLTTGIAAYTAITGPPFEEQAGDRWFLEKIRYDAGSSPVARSRADFIAGCYQMWRHNLAHLVDTRYKSLQRWLIHSRARHYLIPAALFTRPSSILKCVLSLSVRVLLFMLLVVAGDVERNPGPLSREDLEKVSDKELTDDDLYDVLEEVIDLQGKWTDILAGLRLPPSLPSTIKAEHSTDTLSCLQAVLLAWLTKSYNVERYGPPSWRTLVKAVADRIGGADITLALKIAEKHPAPKTASSRPRLGISNDFGISSKSDSSDPETPSNTEHAAKRRAPTGMDVKPDYSPTNSHTNEDMSMKQQELEAHLFHAIEKTEIAFIALRNKIRKICMEQEVSIQAIADIVLPCIQRDDTYPPEFEEGIKVEKSIKKLWDNIEKYTAWYRSIPIEKIGIIVAKLSMDDLENFMAERRWLFKLMEDKYKDKKTKVIKLKIDEDFKRFTDEDLKMVQITMCNVLRNTNITAFTTEKGCVLISLAVPVAVAVNTFPLSPAMCEEFWQAFPSIISLACGNYITEFKRGSTADESESDWNTEEEQESGEWHAGQSAI